MSRRRANRKRGVGEATMNRDTTDRGIRKNRQSCTSDILGRGGEDKQKRNGDNRNSLSGVNTFPEFSDQNVGLQQNFFGK